MRAQQVHEGRHVVSQGYVLISRWALPEHLRPWFDVTANGKGQVLEHSVVMASIIGRAVDYPRETIHHKNGKRADNRPSNLRLYKRGEHHPGYGDFYQEWQEALAEIARLTATHHVGPPAE